MSRWIKLWVSLLDDPTVMGWTPARRFCWAGALLVADEGNPRGSLTQSDGEPFKIAALADKLNVDWHTIADFINSATAEGMLARDSSSGVLRVVNWDKYQQSKVAGQIARSLDTAPSDLIRRELGMIPTIVGLCPTPLKGSRARQEQEEVPDVALLQQRCPATRGRPLPVSIYQIEQATARLRGANERTPRAVASVLEGMSEFDFDRALEKTRRSNARNQAAYLVATLKGLRVDKASSDATANVAVAGPIDREEGDGSRCAA